MKKRPCKKTCKLGSGLPKTTSIEQEVLSMLCDEFLTPKQIALRRGCSTQAVYEIKKKLKEKGLISIVNKRLAKSQCGMQLSQSLTSNNQIRLHGQEFNIRIIFKDQRYRDIKNKANKIEIDGNTIRLYRESIEVYSNTSFFADDVCKATAKSMAYWDKIFARIEHDFKIIIVKSRAQNIKLVKHHYAEVNNEIAEDCEQKGDKINIYAKEDGKLWFTIDNSFNLHEMETVHPETAKEDMDSVKGIIDDIRKNKPMTLTEISKAITGITTVVSKLTKTSLESADNNKETSAGLNALVKLIQLAMNIKSEEKPKDKDQSNQSKMPNYIN